MRLEYNTMTMNFLVVLIQECMNEVGRKRQDEFFYSKEEVKEVLQKVYMDFFATERIEVYKGRKKHEIDLTNVKYITAIDSYVEVITENGKYRKETSLTQLESNIAYKNFFRINRSYLINMEWVDEYRNGMIYIDGMELKVSARNQKIFESQYIEHVHN